MAPIHAVQSDADVKRVSQDEIHAVFTLNGSFRKRPPIAQSILTMGQYWEAGSQVSQRRTRRSYRGGIGSESTNDKKSNWSLRPLSYIGSVTTQPPSGASGSIAGNGTTHRDPSRNLGLDLLRVVATYMVVQIHTGEFYYIGPGGSVLNTAAAHWVGWLNSLFRCCVPLFVMISGVFLFPVRNEGTFFRKRFSRVLVPFFVWCVIYAFYLYWQGTTTLQGALLRYPQNTGELRHRCRAPLVRVHASRHLSCRPRFVAVG